MGRSIFFWFCIYRLETCYTASFLFRPKFGSLGNAVSTLKYVETARLLYLSSLRSSRRYHRAQMDMICLSVCRMSVVCRLSVCRLLGVCLFVVCLSVMKLLPAYGTDHYQNSYLGSLGHCEGQSRFDIDHSPIPRLPMPPKNDCPKWNFVHILLTLAAS